MQINITISVAEEKALDNSYESIDAYVETLLKDRASVLMKEIASGCIEGKISMDELSSEEEAEISSSLPFKIVSTMDSLPKNIIEIIVNKSVLN